MTDANTNRTDIIFKNSISKKIIIFMKEYWLQLILLILVIYLILTLLFFKGCNGNIQSNNTTLNTVIQRLDSMSIILIENNKLKANIKVRDSLYTLRGDSIKYITKLLNEKVNSNNNLTNTQLVKQVREYLYGSK